MGFHVATGNGLDLGLLILRALLAVLLAAHGTQKLFGWFHGPGLLGTGDIFHRYGIRPGVRMAAYAGMAELAGSYLVGTGLVCPLGSAVVIATMVVAVACNFGNGIWAHLGAGYEVPLVYGVIAAALAYTGPGVWSLDSYLGLETRGGYTYGSAAFLSGILCAAPILLRRHTVLKGTSRSLDVLFSNEAEPQAQNEVGDNG